MPPLETRRSERIDYRAPVELLAHGKNAGDTPSCVLARALDLGAGGIQLCAPIQMPVGAQVTCRMTLDGRPAFFPGRVAWLRERDSPHDEGHGMGICFDPLGGHESALLQHVVERSTAGYRAIELHFAGQDQPLVAQAQTTGGGLRIAAALPILARGTELSFRLDAEGPLFTGRIGDAVLKEEHGARRLEVEVEVEGRDGGRFRRHARYGYPDQIQAEERAARVAQAAAAPGLPQGERQRGLGLTIVAAAAVGAALMTWVVIAIRGDEAADPRAEFMVRPRAPGPPSHAGQDESTVSDPSVTSLPHGASKPRPIAAAPSPTNASPQQAQTVSNRAREPVTPTPGIASEAEPQFNALVPLKPAVSSEQAHAEPSLETAAPVNDSDLHVPAQLALQRPQTAIEGDVTLVRIPLEGSLEGMSSRIWVKPRALAVNLPRARSVLALGRYPIDAGGITDLQVNARGAQLLLRIKVSVPISRYTITAADGLLEVRLTRDRSRSPSRLISPATFRKDRPN